MIDVSPRWRLGKLLGRGEDVWLCILSGEDFGLGGTQGQLRANPWEYGLRLVVYKKNPLHGRLPARLDIVLAFLDTRAFSGKRSATGICLARLNVELSIAFHESYIGPRLRELRKFASMQTCTRQKVLCTRREYYYELSSSQLNDENHPHPKNSTP